MTSLADVSSNEQFKIAIQTFSDEDFDDKGFVQPWKIVLMHQYIRAIAMRLIMKKQHTHYFQHHTIFVRHQNVSVDEMFNKKDVLLSLPMHGLFSVLYCGNTSLLLESKIILQNQQSCFSTCKIQMVSVSQKTCKPTAFPDAVKKLYLHHASKAKPEIASLLEYKSSAGQPSYSQQYVIHEEDVDWNKHTTNSSYIKFCIYVANEAVNMRILSHITHDLLCSKLKEFSIHYIGETQKGNKVVFTVWQDSHNLNQLHFEATKDLDVVCRCQLSFNLHPHSLL